MAEEMRKPEVRPRPSLRLWPEATLARVPLASNACIGYQIAGSGISFSTASTCVITLACLCNCRSQTTLRGWCSGWRLSTMRRPWRRSPSRGCSWRTSPATRCLYNLADYNYCAKVVWNVNVKLVASQEPGTVGAVLCCAAALQAVETAHQKMALKERLSCCSTPDTPWSAVPAGALPGTVVRGAGGPRGAGQPGLPLAVRPGGPHHALQRPAGDPRAAGAPACWTGHMMSNTSLQALHQLQPVRMCTCVLDTRVSTFTTWLPQLVSKSANPKCCCNCS